MISFKVSPVEFEQIQRIVGRAEEMCQEFGMRIDRQTLTMDLTAVHANGCPLDLEGLLTCENFDFLHDIGGIVKHINRETGQLEGFFLPRLAKRVSNDA